MLRIAVVAVLITVSCTSASTPPRPASQGVRGRITALAPTIWACPLDHWKQGRSDACDSLATGTVVRIYDRKVRPEYPHGPFALIEYEIAGATKAQWVIDNTVTPFGNDEAYA